MLTFLGGFTTSVRHPFRHRPYWTMNEVPSVYQFMDTNPPEKIFQIHGAWRNMPRYGICSALYKRLNVPLVLSEANPDFPMAEVLDLRALAGRFPDLPLHSTPCVMFACAWLLGYRNIHLEGFNLIEDSDRDPQLAATMEWISHYESSGGAVSCEMLPAWRRAVQSGKLEKYGKSFIYGLKKID